MRIPASPSAITLPNTQPATKQKTETRDASEKKQPEHLQAGSELSPAEKKIVLKHSMSSGALLQTRVFHSLKETTLTAQFGSTQPARGKIVNNVQRSPIQPDEREPQSNGHWQTRVHPNRILVTNDKIKSNEGHTLSNDLNEQLPMDKIRSGKAQVKWDISANGTLIIGETKIPLPEGHESGKASMKLGHPTLVGGMKIPEARISGMIYANSEGQMTINNDSGRFSEYEDRVPEQLKNVAQIFEKHNMPVKTEWVEKKPLPLAKK